MSAELKTLSFNDLCNTLKQCPAFTRFVMDCRLWEKYKDEEILKIAEAFDLYWTPRYSALSNQQFKNLIRKTFDLLVEEGTL